jgi:hypothetical protein
LVEEVGLNSIRVQDKVSAQSHYIYNSLRQKQLGILGLINECVIEKALSQTGEIVNELEDKSIFLDSSAFALIFGTKII